jgi:undecaprenyl phosphate-alpha-L-ara4N flippase subunit ArnE
MFTVQTTFCFVGMISSTVVANVFMKLGASDNEEARWLLGIAGTRTLAGMAFFGVALLLYTWLLRYIPLNIAQSLMAVQFIAVILASTWLLSEPMPSLRWVGIALIAAGVVLVGFTIEKQTRS